MPYYNNGLYLFIMWQVVKSDEQKGSFLSFLIDEMDQKLDNVSQNYCQYN